MQRTSRSWNVYSTAKATAPIPPPCRQSAPWIGHLYMGFARMRSNELLQGGKAQDKAVRSVACLASSHPDN